ncbi:hypothetical protein E2650_06645 [Shewanella xiamenensis]|uniref:Uncharacterized protein n=1 Tax=Shewanella xiamenensis TaxID=332186 RepID=A0AAW6QUU7_9GAMM|nr:hypothetical protein [Shewanella xiamenensis]MDG5899581.1 hypothetical protein [Shewanella xiamenensis]
MQKKSERMDRVEFATLKIYEYVDDLFTCISDLVRTDIEELMNNSSHGLSRDELVMLLYSLFQGQKLVAKTESRGFFTPTYDEIERALNEENDHMHHSNNTYYGLTSGAMEQYRELKQKFKIA